MSTITVNLVSTGVLVMPNEPQDLVTYEEAARATNITVNQVRYLVRTNRLQAYKRGVTRGVWVSLADVKRLTALQPVIPDEDE
jgi:hypothetical protein